MTWLLANWKKIVMVVAVAVATLTADHTMAHKISDSIIGFLPTIDAPAATPVP
jgi:hypothetical protein